MDYCQIYQNWDQLSVSEIKHTGQMMINPGVDKAEIYPHLPRGKNNNLFILYNSGLNPFTIKYGYTEIHVPANGLRIKSLEILREGSYPITMDCPSKNCHGNVFIFSCD